MNFNFGEFYNTQSSFNWLSLVSAVVAAFALYITYRAWKNYDVKKHFIKQQMDTVFELVGTLQKTVFIMDTKDNGSYRSVTIRTNRISEMMYYLSPTYSKYKGTLFSSGILDNNDYLKFVHNPFLPIAIAIELKKLNRYSFNMELKTPDFTQKYVLIKLKGEKFMVDEKDVLRTDKENEYLQKNFIHNISSIEYLNLESFLLQIMKVEIEIFKWLKKFNVKDCNYPFETEKYLN